MHWGWKECFSCHILPSQQENGFYYEFMVIEADCRESKETARYLVDENWEF
jgi:hypothetical protein